MIKDITPLNDISSELPNLYIDLSNNKILSVKNYKNPKNISITIDGNPVVKKPNIENCPFFSGFLTYGTNQGCREAFCKKLGITSASKCINLKPEDIH